MMDWTPTEGKGTGLRTPTSLPCVNGWTLHPLSESGGESVTRKMGTSRQSVIQIRSPEEVWSEGTGPVCYLNMGCSPGGDYPSQ